MKNQILIFTALVAVILFSGCQKVPVKLQIIDGGGRNTYPKNISGDGRYTIAVTESRVGLKGFRWSNDAGIEFLSTKDELNLEEIYTKTPPIRVWPWHCNYDGSIVTGTSNIVDGGWSTEDFAYQWTMSNGMVSLFQNTDSYGSPTGSSAGPCSMDGTVIVGTGKFGSAKNKTFIWKRGAELRMLEEHLHLNDLTPDGNYAVGKSYSTDTAILLHVSESVSVASVVPASENIKESTAVSISDDGKTILGVIDEVPFILLSGEFKILTDIFSLSSKERSGKHSITGLDMSGSGDRIIGNIDGNPFMWTPNSGFTPLLSFETPEVAFLRKAKNVELVAISKNGRYVVGYFSDGSKARGFRLEIQ